MIRFFSEDRNESSDFFIKLQKKKKMYLKDMPFDLCL